jgi:hypothetical protein
MSGLWLNTLPVVRDDKCHGNGALTAPPFDALLRSRQETDALADAEEIFVVDVRIFECQRLGQGTDQIDFVCCH